MFAVLREKMKKGAIAALVLSMVMLAGGLDTTATEVVDVNSISANDTGITTTSGVAYIYSEGENPSVNGINLNGNSVIIQASDNDSSDNRLINIIIDKDKDGVIDEGEPMVAIDGETDLIGGPTIYGYYNVEATEPISITSISGYTPVIFGAYQSSLKTSGETAVTMRMLGGEIPGYFYAANGSQVISTGAPAVEIYLNTESTTYTSQIAAGYSSEIVVSGTDKPGICIEADKANVGSLYALYSSSYTYKESSSAGVKIDINGEGVSSVYGIQSGIVTADGNETALFDINIKSKVSVLYGSSGATLNAGKNTATAMDIDVTENGYITGNGYGVYGGSNSGSSCVVTGHVNVDYTPNKSESDYNINWFYAVSHNLMVDGNVTVKLENTRGYSFYAVNNHCYVTGDVTLDMPKGNELTSNVYGMYGSKCDGNLTMRVHGCTENVSAYNNIYGYSGRYATAGETVIGGDFVFDYLGGRCYYLYPGNGSYGSASVYDKIGGKADITVRKGDLGSVYLIQYADVAGDITATVGDYTTDLTVSGNELASCVISNSFNAVTYCKAKNVTYKARITNGNSDSKPYHNGVQNSNISGDLKVELDGGCYYHFYASYNCVVGGNADIQIKNINKDLENNSSGGTCYGFYNGNVVGNINVNVEDCQFNGFYATSYHGCEGSITSTIKNVKVYNYLYGPHPSGCAGDIVSTMTDISANYVYGVYQYGKIGGNVTVNIKNANQDTRSSTYCYLYGIHGNSNYSAEKDVKVTVENAVFNNSYPAYNCAVMGNLEVDIIGGTYGSATQSTTNYFASPSYVKGTSTINVSDATYYGSVYPYYCYSGGCGDAKITVKNTQFNTGYYPNSEQIAMTPGVEQKVTMTLDEDCTVADTLKIYAGGSSGEGKITYDGETYIGGAIRFTEDITYDAIHFSGGNLHIAEGVTLKIDELYWDSGNILLDGTLNATIMNELDEETGVYPGTTVYMAGGTMNVDLTKIQTVYWPFEINYKAKGGTVAYYNNYNYKPITHTLGGNRLFGKVGQEIKYNISAVEGYTLASVTYTADGVTNNVANSGTTYTFTMPNAAVSFDIDFKGNQIVVGKTTTDPILKLNVATTAESPAYDLSTLSISNDGLTGSVAYKVDSTYTLPEGLSLEGDKIIGTPTVAYESGKKTIIHVTGKNDTQVEVPINFVVTAGTGTQTSQEGRITVDETNQLIYLNGNSVTIETQDNQTAIYLDDNRDGVADFDTPAVVGDYTNYTLYGLRNTDTKLPICITMHDGTIGKIFGAQNGDITASGNGLGIYIYGGNVGEVCALDTASVVDTFELIMKPEATVTTYSVSKNSASRKGYLLQAGTSVAAYGIYDFKEDITADTLTLGGTHIIPKGVTLQAKKLYRMDGAIIRLRGTLLADNCVYNYYGKVYVQDGTLPENCTWNYTYYPTVASTNIKNTKVTFSTNSSELTDDGVKTTYLHAGYSVNATVTEAPGYDYYYSVNGSEMTQFTGTTFTFTGPREESEVDVTYIPKQISLKKLFADPVGKVGTEYTAEAPLYDLRGLTLVDDTTADYGGDVKYTLKSGSTLPAGLTFEDGRVIGTPTKVDLTGTTVSFVVTGRNGTTETVDVVFKIAGEDYKEKDINDCVKVSTTNSTIDLQGTSVIVLEDPLNTSNSQIYMDENRDGTADNNNPLLLGSATSANLNSYTIYGYTDIETPYEGDISITVKGGNLKAVYGAKGTGSSEKYWAKVNGTVTLNLGDVYMSGTATGVYGAQWAQVTNVNVNVTDGYYAYTEFYGANVAKVTGNLSLEMADDIYLYTSSSSSSYHIYVYGVRDAEVSGNVNIRLAPKDSTCFGSNAYRYSSFFGLYEGTVGGNVVCDVDGYWNTGNWRLMQGSDVTGDVDLNIADGAYLDCYNTYSTLSDYPTVAMTSTIGGDTGVNIAENGTFTLYGLYIFHNSDGGSITVDVPKTAQKNISNLTLFSNTSSSVTGASFVNQRGAVTITGNEYTIAKDLEATGLTLNDTIHVTIAQDVAVKTTSSKLVIAAGAKLTNNGMLEVNVATTGTSTGIGGTLINNGTLKNISSNNNYKYYFPIVSGGCVINNEGAQWDVAGSVYNLGKIVNYGTFNQTYGGTYCYYLGSVYTTEPLTLAWDPATNTYYKSTYMTSSVCYPDIYYPITIEYPSHCLASATITGDAISTSGVDGDTRQYVRALHPADTTPTFTVTLGEQLLDTVTLSSVTYGPNNSLASVQTDGSWLGCAQNIFEPITVTVNYDAADEEATAITLDKTSDRIENTDDSQPLVYNKYYSYSNPLYNLADLTITNDMEGDGEVTYYLDSSSTLPSGMYFKDGRLYGTFRAASDADQAITFIVKGKNQTSAFFTLTLGPVAKQVPSWSVPTGLQALVSDTLADVYLPYNASGTYSWPDATVSVGSEITTLEDMTLLFTPKDTANYDWAKAATAAGATYADGVITCKVDIQVCAGVPTYTVPDKITATYGDTYGEVAIPSGDNDGKFEWYYASTSTVGNVGTWTRWVSYIPNDSNYQTVNYIEVTLVIEKAVPTYKKITSVSQECGSTLADIVLPDAEGGKYQWITTATTIPLDGKTYQVGFKPNDTSNYDWTQIEGWNDAWKCVVFPITVYLEHTYSTELAYNDTHHWHPCLDETCDSVEGKEEHLWDEGFVLEEATMEKAGVIEYSCECGASYEDTIPKLTHASHVYTGAWKYDADTHWKQCTYTDCVETTEPADHDFDEGVPVSAPTASAKGVVKYTCEVCKYVETEYLSAQEWENSGWGDDEEEAMEVGDSFEDPDTKAEYEIASGNNEVIYLAPDKKTYSKITIPNTVEFDGIHYKVTEIAPNAFKGNKKLKSIKIGSNIKTIGARAFYGCTKLTTVTMGNNVTTIGNSAFQNCTSLKKFTIPKNVSKIGSKAFYGCKKLTKMTIKTSKLTDKKVGKNAFKNMGKSNFKKTTVKVPKKKLKTYKKMLVKRGLSKKAKVKK